MNSQVSAGAGRALVGWLVAAALVGGCAMIPGVGGGAQRMGPVHHLGPVPAFAGGAPFPGTDELAFFRTRDGWCTEFAGGTGCAGGGPPSLPTGFRGFGGTSSREGTCIETLTGNEVVRIEVDPDGVDPVVLRPLGGSADAPINAFAACWGQPVALEAIEARAFDANGDEVDSLAP